MSHTPHELADDFPQDVEKIHELKVSNPHFAKLMDEYHEINRGGASCRDPGGALRINSPKRPCARSVCA